MLKYYVSVIAVYLFNERDERGYSIAKFFWNASGVIRVVFMFTLIL